MTCVSSSKTELCGNLGDDAEMIHRRYDTALLMFLLRQRRQARYSPLTTIQPGDPVYERLKAMWQAEEFVSAEEVRASLDAKLARLREVVLESQGHIEDQAGEERGGA